MELIDKSVLKFKHLPEKIHGSVSFCTKTTNKSILDFSSSCMEIKFEETFFSFLNSKNLNYYPDPDSKELKKSLGEVLNISDENILITNGSSEAIFLIGLAFCSKNSTVFVPEITYSEYERAAKIFSSTVKKIPLKESNHFAVSIETLEEALKSKPDVVFLCNPNNPTGHYMDNTVLELFKKHLETLFVLDEAYIDFVEKPWLSFKSLTSENVIILRSFTKSLGLAGLRLGYLAAPTKIIRLFDHLKVPWNVNYPAACIGNYIIKNPDIFKNEIKQYIEGKNLLFNYFKESYFAIPSQTNYFLLKVINSKLLYQRFFENNILIRECSSFGLKNYVRINARKVHDCEKFLEVFEKIS
ncbi:MAG: histidinol-phosphate transaminase [Nitrospinota bacterium]|mgnify:FL=1|jgi:histidinol-phosphate aminotransferase|nr:histidinol-phosphate transaminase [Nitrospinota bacterium]HJN03361.1 histidinol-phosphate transaminase [Nitrospinota bacterium]